MREAFAAFASRVRQGSVALVFALGGASVVFASPVTAGQWLEERDGLACLSLPIGPQTRWEERATDTEWRLRLYDVPDGLQLPQLQHPVLGALETLAEGRNLEAVLPWRYWCPSRVETDGVSFLRVYFESKFERREHRTVAAGVTYTRLHRGDGIRALTCHALRVDLKQPGVAVRPVLAKSTIAGVLPVAQFVERHGAIAGINGAFFSMKTAEPLGLMILNRELVSGPLYHRSALLLGTGVARVVQTALGLRLQVPSNETYECDGVNTRRGFNRLVLFNSRFGPSTQTPLNGLELAVDAVGRVLALGQGNLSIPPNGWVVSAHGQAADWLQSRVRLGDTLLVSQPLLERWTDARDVLGAGPRLVVGGERRVQALEERFSSDVAAGLAPRSAVGIDREQRLLLLAVEGRYPARSAGLTLSGLADLLREFGAQEGLNLDGGGSTQMVVENQLVTRPSDSGLRPVNNALLVFAPPGTPEPPTENKEN